MAPPQGTGAASDDPLVSWCDGATKKSIVDFVALVTKAGGVNYVAPEERIATFDNDGTLWAEQPFYFQLAFALDRIRALAPQHPKWRGQEPFKSALAGDLQAIFARGEPALTEIVTATHFGITTDEFAGIVRTWLATTRHPKTNGYSPKWCSSRCWSCSPTCGPTISKRSSCRPAASNSCEICAETTYGVPPEQVIGSSGKLAFEMRDGSPVLVKLLEIEFVNDNAGKPVAIQKHIGRRPIASFGNSDGDLEMLQWTTAGTGARFAMLIQHTDMNSGNGPMTATHLSGASTRRWMKLMRRDGRSSI